jgi:hypothetical protein
MAVDPSGPDAGARTAYVGRVLDHQLVEFSAGEHRTRHVRRRHLDYGI